jgi:hypothetical protein
MIKLTGDQLSRREAISHELAQQAVGRKNYDRPRALIGLRIPQWSGQRWRESRRMWAATGGRRTLTAWPDSGGGKAMAGDAIDGGVLTRHDCGSSVLPR